MSTVEDVSATATVGDATPSSLLGFQSGGEHWLVDLAEAGEVMPVPALSDVPLTKVWFRGIANIRGTLYGVSDLAAFHGDEPTAIKTQSRLLLAGARAGSHHGSNMALLMSSTLGLKALAKLDPVAAPPNAIEPWRGKTYRDADGQVWTHLLLSALLIAPRFLDIAA